MILGNKFNVGDRVKIVFPKGHFHGQVGTITEFKHKEGYVVVTNDKGMYCGMWDEESSLELIEKGVGVYLCGNCGKEGHNKRTCPCPLMKRKERKYVLMNSLKVGDRVRVYRNRDDFDYKNFEKGIYEVIS